MDIFSSEVLFVTASKMDPSTIFYAQAAKDWQLNEF